MAGCGHNLLAPHITGSKRRQGWIAETGIKAWCDITDALQKKGCGKDLYGAMGFLMKSVPPFMASIHF